MGTIDLNVIDSEAMHFLRGAEDEITQASAHAEILDQAKYLPTFEEMAAATPAIEAQIGIGSIVAPVAAPLAVGAAVETALLRNEHWDNFWIHVGSNLNNWWHHAAGYLFGVASVGMHEVQAAINLSAHVQMRAVRQLYTRVLSRALTAVSHLAKIVAFQQREISRLAHAHLMLQKYVDRHILRAIQITEHHADVEVRALRHYVDDKTALERAYLEQWATDHIYKPLKADVNFLNARISQVERSIPSMARAAAIPVVAASVGPLTQALKGVSNRVRTLEEESDECTQPMCETMGPKTDWGKLFKRFKPALIFALLAELAALNPDEVAKAAEALANGLGPVLERWVIAYVGVLPGGTHEQPSEVTKAIGHNPLI